MTDRLLLAGVVGFALGICAYAAFTPDWPCIAFAGLLAVLAGISYALAKRPLYALFACALMGIALGAGRTLFAPQALPAAFVPMLETRVSFEGVVVAEPDVREIHQRVTLLMREGESTTRVLAVAPLYPSVRYGETVHAEGTFVRPEPFETDNGRTFRYDAFLAKDGVFALIEEAEVEVVEERRGILAHTRGALLDTKRAFLDGLSAAIPEPQASLAGGLIAGGKQGLGTELLEAFIATGLVHIVVLSGYNVMIVAEAVLRAFAFLPVRVAATLATLTIGAFVFAAGAGAASIRAGLMAGIGLFARASGRTYAALRALILVGVFMLLSNPLLLPYDPGFQLSFVATLGLILGTSLIEPRLGFVPLHFMREIVSATIAAQIAVLPLLLYQNGLFSVVALPANVLVLPVIPAAMAASAFAGLVGFIIPAIAPIAGLPAYILLSYITVLTQLLNALPLASFSVPAFPFLVVPLAYAVLGYLVWRYRKKTLTGATLRSV